MLISEVSLSGANAHYQAHCKNQPSSSAKHQFRPGVRPRRRDMRHVPNPAFQLRDPPRRAKRPGKQAPQCDRNCYGAEMLQRQSMTVAGSMLQCDRACYGAEIGTKCVGGFCYLNEEDRDGPSSLKPRRPETSLLGAGASGSGSTRVLLAHLPGKCSGWLAPPRAGTKPHSPTPMKPLERYLATLEGRPVDHLARLPILMQFAAERIGSHYGDFASDYRVLTAANMACAGEFGIDQMNTMSDPYRETQGFGAKIIYERDMVPHCERHPLEDDPDFAKLPRPDPWAAGRMRDRIEAVRVYQERVGGEYSIMGWVEGPAAEAADLRRLDNFFMDLLDDEGYVGGLMDLCVEVALDFARAQVAAGADTIGIGDAVASQVSPAVYERLILPREQRLVRGLQAMGAKVRMHICGNIAHLLPGLATLDLDVIDVDHMVSVARVREMLGRKIAIGGNLDPVADILRGTPDTIRAKLERCYDEAGNPFMVNAGCEIPSATPAENLQALCAPLAFARA